MTRNYSSQKRTSFLPALSIPPWRTVLLLRYSFSVQFFVQLFGIFKFCKALPIFTTTSHRNQAIRGYLWYFYSSMGDTDEPISILIDELRNEDISSRLKSMSKVCKELFLKAKWIDSSFQQSHSLSESKEQSQSLFHSLLTLFTTKMKFLNGKR